MSINELLYEQINTCNLRIFDAINEICCLEDLWRFNGCVEKERWNFWKWTYALSVVIELTLIGSEKNIANCIPPSPDHEFVGEEFSLGWEHMSSGLILGALLCQIYFALSFLCVFSVA